jgi:hypothetical protein
MKTERKKNAQRLAKSLPENQPDAAVGRARKNTLRPQSGGNAQRAMANECELSPLARLVGALTEEKIEIMLIGMSAAVVQGVPGSTIDVDLWVNLPARQYMRVMNVCRRLGASLAANTVVELQDCTLVNFVYAVTGLGTFDRERKFAKVMKFNGLSIPVLSLERILKSKKCIQRPKDLVHIEQIESTLAVKRKVAGKKLKMAARHGFEP